jgi:hypothetical protein
MMLAPRPYADAIKSRPEVSVTFLNKSNRQVDSRLLSALPKRLDGAPPWPERA